MKETNLNVESVPRELFFLLELLKEEQSSHIVDMQMIDWSHFLDLALHHRLYPLLHQKIKEMDFIPSEVKKQLANYYRKNTFQMLKLSAEMSWVNATFKESDIPIIFLKGPNLAHDLYGDLSLRTCSDLDVLIPISQLKKAEELLSLHGYIKDDYIETILGDWSWRHHHITFFHKEKGVKLEIHWRLNPGPAFEPSFDQLWKHKRMSELLKEPLYILGREDLFFFLVTHGARHGWSRLRWLCDIQQMLKADLNWREVMKKMKKYHVEKVGGQAFLLAEGLLDSQLPKYANRITDNKSMKLAQEAIFYLENMVNLHTDPVPKYVSKYHGRHLFSMMSPQQKCLSLISWLFPYPEDAETLPLPKVLHFLYFPLRPILWVWRKIRRNIVSKKVNIGES